jgi:DNA topoisomerase-1
VGVHPDEGGMIQAGIGRYGPYVQHNGTYANLPNADEVFDIGINRAVAVLAEKRAGGPRGGRAPAVALKELGAHPADGQPVRILSGRFGPYIKHGAVNANVPRGSDPQALSLDEAVKLLEARAANGGGKKKPARAAAKATAPAKASAKPAAKKAAPKKKPSAKKAAAKKPAAKKTAAG